MRHYIWPSVLLWIVDRLFRVIRTAVFHGGIFRSKYDSMLDAYVEVLSSDFLRITLRCPSYLHWYPGQFAYLSIPGLSTFGAHPFTISNVNLQPGSKEADMYTKEQASNKSLDTLTFIIKVRSGLTRRIRSASRADEPMRVLFDGPYGQPPLLLGFETVILIAGTIIVTVTIN